MVVVFAGTAALSCGLVALVVRGHSFRAVTMESHGVNRQSTCDPSGLANQQRVLEQLDIDVIQPFEAAGEAVAVAGALRPCALDHRLVRFFEERRPWIDVELKRDLNFSLSQAEAASASLGHAYSRFGTRARLYVVMRLDIVVIRPLPAARIDPQVLTLPWDVGRPDHIFAIGTEIVPDFLEMIASWEGGSAGTSGVGLHELSQQWKERHRNESSSVGYLWPQYRVVGNTAWANYSKLRLSKATELLPAYLDCQKAPTFDEANVAVWRELDPRTDPKAPDSYCVDPRSQAALKLQTSPPTRAWALSDRLRTRHREAAE